MVRLSPAENTLLPLPTTYGIFSLAWASFRQDGVSISSLVDTGRTVQTRGIVGCYRPPPTTEYISCYAAVCCCYEYYCRFLVLCHMPVVRWYLLYDLPLVGVYLVGYWYIIFPSDNVSYMFQFVME